MNLPTRCQHHAAQIIKQETVSLRVRIQLNTRVWEAILTSFILRCIPTRLTRPVVELYNLYLNERGMECHSYLIGPAVFFGRSKHFDHLLASHVNWAIIQARSQCCNSFLSVACLRSLHVIFAWND